MQNLAIWLMALELTAATVLGLPFWCSIFGHNTNRRWLYLLMAIVLAITAATGIAGPVFYSYMHYSETGSPVAYRGPSTAMAALFLAGSVWLFVRGARRRDGRLAVNRWSRQRLFLAWILSWGLLALTIALVDRRAQAFAAEEQSRLMAAMAELNGPPPADADNAALIYQPAFDEMERIIEEFGKELKSRDEQLASTRPDDAEEPPDPPWRTDGILIVENLFSAEHCGKPETIELLARLEPALAKIERASRLTACRFPGDSVLPRIDDTLVSSRRWFVRNAGTAISARARERARQGKIDAAIEDIWVILRLSGHVDQFNPGVLPSMIRIGLCTMALDTLAGILPQCKAVPTVPPDMLADPVAVRQILDRALRGEEAIVIGTLLRFAGSEFPMDQVLPGQEQFNWRLAILDRVLWLRPDVSVTRNYFAAWRDHLAGRTVLDDAADRRLRNQGGPLTRLLLMTPLRRVLFVGTDFQANLAQMRVAVALTAYRLHHGTYPKDSSSLVPQYMPAIPPDPRDGKPMRYRLEENGAALIYSVGENGTDDGGSIDTAEGERYANRKDNGIRLKPATRPAP